MSKAFFITTFGNSKKAFELRSLTLPNLLDNQVQIEVEAFGLNYADVMARRGHYREAPKVPFVPGYDVVGTVVDTGKGVSPELKGKRVAAFTRFGGYATHGISLEAAVIQIEETPATDALALCTQGVTAYYMAEYSSRFRSGEFALVHAGAGGVGSLLIQMLVAKGVKVIAKVSTDEKVKLVESLGAMVGLNYLRSDYAVQVKEWVGDVGLAASFNAVGGATVKKDLQLLAPGGKLFLFGGADLLLGKWGILSTLNFVRKTGFYTPIPWMMQSKSICGVNMLRIADHNPKVIQDCLQGCFDWYRSGQLKPVNSAKVSTKDLCQIHDDFENGKTTGKIAVYWD